MSEQSVVADELMELVKASGVSLQEVLSQLGLKAVQAEEKAKRETRTTRRSEWHLSKQLVDVKEKRKHVKKLADVLGSAPTPREPRLLGQDEVDALAAEILLVRETLDDLTGRQSAIKWAVWNAITTKYEADDKIAEPEHMPDALYSPKHGVKLCKEVRGGGSWADWSLLETILDEETWLTVTDRVEVVKTIHRGDGSIETEQTEERVINELEVMRALQSGAISIEHLAQITKVKPKTNAWTVRPIKAGETVPC